MEGGSCSARRVQERPGEEVCVCEGMNGPGMACLWEGRSRQRKLPANHFPSL